MVVTKANASQSRIFLPGLAVFREYHFKSRDGEASEDFCVNPSVIRQCLSIFGTGKESNPTMQFGYRGSGNALILQLEEAGVLTDCQVIIILSLLLPLTFQLLSG